MPYPWSSSLNPLYGNQQEALRSGQPKQGVLVVVVGCRSIENFLPKQGNIIYCLSKKVTIYYSVALMIRIFERNED